jgi:hypothetical protein
MNRREVITLLRGTAAASAGGQKEPERVVREP